MHRTYLEWTTAGRWMLWEGWWFFFSVAIEGLQIQMRGKVGTGGTGGKVRNSGVLELEHNKAIECAQ